MDEIVVDHAEIVAVIHGVEQLLAHAHQRRGAARRKIEPAEQFEAARFAGEMQFTRCLVGRRLPPGGDGAVDGGPIVAECRCQRFKEGDPRPGGEFAVERQDLLRQGDARSLAAARQQLLAEFDQTGRALMRRFPALALDQCAAPVGDALQHFAEERAIHGFIPTARPFLANDRAPP